MRLFIFFLLWLPIAAWAQKIHADVACKPTGTDFVYDCIITLSRGGEPLSGARISIGADMPSMPMAHNLKPVIAKPGSAPGEYTARLDLEMQGEWALKLRLSGPVRDLIVKKLKFE
jgi:hypothetical protein